MTRKIPSYLYLDYSPYFKDIAYWCPSSRSFVSDQKRSLSFWLGRDGAREDDLFGELKESYYVDKSLDEDLLDNSFWTYQWSIWRDNFSDPQMIGDYYANFFQENAENQPSYCLRFLSFWLGKEGMRV